MSARRGVYGIYAIRQLLYNVVALGGRKRADDLFARSIGPRRSHILKHALLEQAVCLEHERNVLHQPARFHAPHVHTAHQPYIAILVAALQLGATAIRSRATSQIHT